ncbi:hypothetical protein ACS0TY_020297 [Phlomoides rotata]
MLQKSKKNNNGEQQKEGVENKKKENAGGKNNITTVVLKADLSCEGCISKVLKCIRSFDGVETADIGGEQKITVVGKVDPAKLRERVEQKTHKRVELISPQPKKDNNNSEKAKGKENSGGENVKQHKKKGSIDKKPKEKEPPLTTAMLKVPLHCEGCTKKIHKIITKTKGYRDVKIDKQKEVVTVTGAIDMKALTEVLKKHLKREVQIVPPPKKEAEKKENAGGEKGKNGGGDKGKCGGDKAAGGEKMESRAQFQVGYPYPYVYGAGIAVDQFHNPYEFGPYHTVHAPQLFSDENPNACSVM